MSSFDRNSRRLAMDELTNEEGHGPGPSKRARGGLGFGLAVSFVLGISLLISSSCAALQAMAPGVAPTTDGLCIELRLSTADGRDPTAAELERTRSIMQSRLDATGLAHPVVRAVEPDGLEMALPFIEAGSEDADPFHDLVSTVGILEFIPVPPALADELLEGGPLPPEMAELEPLFDGAGVASVRVGEDEQSGASVIDLELDEIAAAAFDAYAEAHFGERFAIVLDGVIEVAPTIMAKRYDGRAQISGDFTTEEAHGLVTVLKLGPLPLEIAEMSERACSPPQP